MSVSILLGGNGLASIVVLAALLTGWTVSRGCLVASARVGPTLRCLRG
jgi:hypothetical protein